MPKTLKGSVLAKRKIPEDSRRSERFYGLCCTKKEADAIRSAITASKLMAAEWIRQRLLSGLSDDNGVTEGEKREISWRGVRYKKAEFDLIQQAIKASGKNGSDWIRGRLI